MVPGERASRRDWLILLVMMSGMVLFFLDKLTLSGYWGNIIASGRWVLFCMDDLFMRRQKRWSRCPPVTGNLWAGAIGLPFMFQSMPDLSG